MKTQILLADGHLLFRQGLGKLLEVRQDIQIAAEAGDGKQVLEVLKRRSVDLLITEASLPKMNGIELIRAVIEHHDCRALVLSARSDSHCVVQALEAGASGFLTKTCRFEQLLEAIDTVSQGRTYLGSDVADVVVQHYVRHNGTEQVLDSENGSKSRGNGQIGSRSLTRREREVLQLLTEGYATKQIAADLDVSVKTVDTHRAAMMRKLAISNLAHLTKYAIRQGITSLEQ